MMGKNEQSQGQELNVDAATKKEKADCYWFKPMVAAKGQIGRLKLEGDPMAFKKVDVVLYQGKVSQVICPYLNGNRCSSPEKDKERDECYLLPGTSQSEVIE